MGGTASSSFMLIGVVLHVVVFFVNMCVTAHSSFMLIGVVLQVVVLCR